MIVVQSLWIDPVLGEHQRICIDSFIKMGHEYHLYTYKRVDNVPEEVLIKDANEILPEKLIFKDLFNSYATFSDWFRIQLLHDKGGWWVDCDMLCMRPFDIDWPYVFATELEIIQADEKITHICNCVIKMPKENVVAKTILQKINARLAVSDPRQIKWTEIGAKYLTTEIVTHNLFDFVVDSRVFCPFDYSNFKAIATHENIVLDEITYGIHLWNKMWEWDFSSPMAEMTANSFLHQYIWDLKRCK